MSALGHKRTFAPQNVMSALPQIATAKADIAQQGKTSRSNHQAMSALPFKAVMCSAQAHVCFGPKADITASAAFFKMLAVAAIKSNKREQLKVLRLQPSTCRRRYSGRACPWYSCQRNPSPRLAVAAMP